MSFSLARSALPSYESEPVVTEGSAGPTRSAISTLGTTGGRLLAGPGPDGGPEPLAAHLARLGPLPALPAARIIELSEASGLQGRGGGEFPIARKLAAADGGLGVVVANGSEGEPASRKDRLLVEHRPHLVLDGLALAAAATGATDAVVYLHAGRARSRAVLEHALAERRAFAMDPDPVLVATAPERFVAGESSAVVSFLEARDARPRRSPTPAAVRGVHGRPTVVSNVETLAHLALLARFGSEWFRQAGTPGAPGSSLLTLAGATTAPGSVVEVLRPVTLGSVLEAAGGLAAPPPAVLLGGYGGSWISGVAAWDAPLDRAALRALGVGLGCGLVAPLAPGACGLAVTARLLSYLASQSAGQCGCCVHGLATIADVFSTVAAGEATRADVRRLHVAARSIQGAGGCAHPDGAAALVESALTVFGDEVAAHLRRRPRCGGVEPSGGWFPTATVLGGVVGRIGGG